MIREIRADDTKHTVYSKKTLRAKAEVRRSVKHFELHVYAFRDRLLGA